MSMNPRLLRPLATGFNPLTLSGLEAWWDFADSSTVTLDAGRVSAIADKSGNGRTAANGTSGSTQPDYETGARNGRNVARFAAASTQRLTVASSTATFKFLHDGTASYIAAACSFGDTANPDAFYGLLGTNAATTFNVGFYAGYDDRVASARSDFLLAAVTYGTGGAFAAATVQNNPPTFSTLEAYNNFFIPQTAGVLEISLDADNATASSRLVATRNGLAFADNRWTNATVGSNAAFDLQLGCLGNNAIPMTGDICEVLIFSQQPTASQRSSIRRYLAQKWGVALA